MNKADKYFQELLWDIEHNGIWSNKPRTRWEDGTPANYKSVYHKTYTYDISKGEFPITTLRTTPLKACFHEMEWIYLKQSNIIEEAHKSIHGWWESFVIDAMYTYLNPSKRDEEDGIIGCDESHKEEAIKEGKKLHTTKRFIGKTYGYVVKEYDLMNRLLHDLEHNSESRRKMMCLWDNQSQMEDNKALPPCAYATNWIMRNTGEHKQVDLTLFQRSRDTLLTYSINPVEYVILAMMVCNHLTFKTGILHKVGYLTHHVEDEHIYDRNYWALNEILERKETGIQPKIELVCEPKDFYNHTWEDFKVTGLEGVEKLSKKLEMAI